MSFESHQILKHLSEPETRDFISLGIENHILNVLDSPQFRKEDLPPLDVISKTLSSFKDVEHLQNPLPGITDCWKLTIDGQVVVGRKRNLPQFKVPVPDQTTMLFCGSAFLQIFPGPGNEPRLAVILHIELALKDFKLTHPPSTN